jgi:predicted alpha/beta hydrolase
VGLEVFLDMNAERRMRQVFVRRLRVPITKAEFEDHPERCADALYEAHENAQHRLQQKLDERWVA